MEAVAHYYKHHFPRAELCELWRRSWTSGDSLSKRELCVETAGGKYIRFLSVSSAEQLAALFETKGVEKFHTGAVYDHRPSLRWDGVPLTAVRRELTFDIDLDDYDGIDKDDVEECDRNWPLVAFGFVVVEHCLIHHFGFKHTLMVYSGRRGAHLTVYDARACALSDEARSAIVSWFQPRQAALGSARADYGHITKSAGFGAFFQTYVLPFWRDVCITPRSKGGLGMLDSVLERGLFMELFADKGALETVSLNGMSGAAAWDTLLTYAATVSACKAATMRALNETVLAFVWPKLDRKVTEQMGHLSKCVMSLHPKTGRLCMPIRGDPFLFDPSKCATLSAVVVNEDPNALKQVRDGRVALANLAKRLAVSGTERWKPAKLDSLPPAVYTMTGCKRSHGAYEHFTGTDRVCGSVVRVFSAVSLSADPYKVTLYFHTELCRESVHVIPAGYSLPWRSGKFPVGSFEKGVEKARSCPGSEVECCRAFVLVLFGKSVTRDAGKKRLDRMADGLLRPQQLCTVNGMWEDSGVIGMIRSQVKGAWDVRQVHIGCEWR